VRVSLNTGTTQVRLSNLTEHRGLGLSHEPEHPYDFYVGAWMGCDNPHMPFEMLKAHKDGTGSARLTVPILAGDTNALKIGCYVKDPDTHMQLHLASGYQPLLQIADAIQGVTSFEQAKSSLLLKDNYSKNQALLHFCDDGTDIPQLRALCQRLRPSAMEQTVHLNARVLAMASGVHDLIERVSRVDNKNGGPGFVNNVCFLQAAGCVVNYPLLGMTYDSHKHRAPLSMLSYMALSTLHLAGLSAQAALDLPNDEFMSRFVVPMCTSFTVCPSSCVYSGDKTLDAKGNLDQPTEDFAMVLSKHFYTAVQDHFQLGEEVVSMSDTRLKQHIANLKQNPRLNAQGHILIADDCETEAGMIKSFEGGIHLAAEIHAGGDHRVLGELMWESTRGLQNLSAVPKSDYYAVAKLLCRFGHLKANALKDEKPNAQIAYSVVSAKGASFRLGESALNGHACTVSRTVDANGKASYCIGEGTTNLRMRDLPEGCVDKVRLKLEHERYEDFTLRQALCIINQNMAELTNLGSGLNRLEQTIPNHFQKSDPYSCPFYMSTFFMCLDGGKYIPAVIPLDMRSNNARNAMPNTLAGDCGDGGFLVRPESLAASPEEGPLFGAPVAGLDCEFSKALPIDLGFAMGDEHAKEFLGGLLMRNEEAHTPRDSDENFKKLMSPWGPVDPLPKEESVQLSIPYDPEPRRKESTKESTRKSTKDWLLCNAEGFRCADLLRAAAEHKGRIAKEFNRLQENDPASDGIKMTVRQHMLSVVCQFHVPLPETENWSLSCARNMRTAVAGRHSLTLSAEVRLG
jgi:hypothetical protein